MMRQSKTQKVYRYIQKVNTLSKSCTDKQLLNDKQKLKRERGNMPIQFTTTIMSTILKIMKRKHIQ